jgi:methyl-accepting chemotaxis protein
MAGGKNQRRFKNYLINPKYQGHFLFAFAALGIALILINLWVFYTYGLTQLSFVLSSAAVSPDAQDLIMSEFRHVFVLITLAMLLGLMVLSALTVAYSHRTAGPLFHFKRVFDRIRAGELDARVVLRTGDYFREEADAFNQMMDEMAKKNPK